MLRYDDPPILEDKIMDRRGFLRNIAQTILFASLVQRSNFSNSDIQRLASATAEEAQSTLAPPNRSRIRMTFDNFVDHEGSAMARLSAILVAITPHVYSNPLILCGDNGLGKTHLLQAISNAFQERHPSVKSRTVHAEVFHNEMIRAYRTGSIHSFRRHYQSWDFLLIDDLDFLQGKPAGQGELFSIVSHMKEHGKQVVAASHKAPGSLEGFEQMLVSYLTTEGRTIVMTPPDQNAQFKIVLSKAQQNGMWLEDRHAHQIVEYVSDRSVRDLEGAVYKVIATSRFLDRPISSSLIEEALGPIFA
jgi:chromosomal replication initiator protein